MLFVVHEIAGIAFILCKSLQSHAVLLCNAHLTLNRLVLEISSKVSIVRSLSEVQLSAFATATGEISDLAECAFFLAAFRGFMEDVDFFDNDCLVAMYNASRDTLLKLSAEAILRSADGISVIVTKRTKDNGAYLDTSPIVVLHQLVHTQLRSFFDYLHCQLGRFDFIFCIEEIEDFGRQYKSLCESHRH